MAHQTRFNGIGMIDRSINLTCFSQADLRAYVQGKLPDNETDRLEHHLTTCDKCRRALVESCGDDADEDLSAWELEQETPRVPSQNRVGKYLLGREIGRGGMGVLYDALDEETRSRVAVKFINVATAGRGACKRAIQEFHALSRLSHPNIVPVLNAVSHEDRPFLVMDYVDGLPLNVWQNLRPIDAVLAAKIVCSLADAIDYAHRQNVIHRDLKPSNVMVSGFGPDDAQAADAPLDVKVTDFGLAKIIGSDSEITQTGEVIGTPAYMSPEQTSGVPDQIGPAADIYGLGAILYELLVGRPPLLSVDPIRTLELVRNTDPIPPLRLRPDLPKSLNTICLKCLEKSPIDRYPTAMALADDLTAFISHKQITARPPGPIKQVTRWGKRNRGLAIGLSVAAISLIALLAGSLWFAKSQRELRVVADQEKRNAQRAEAVATEQKRLAIAKQERERQFWARSLQTMHNFSSALGNERILGLKSHEAIRANAESLVVSLYDDYVQQLGPVDQWTLEDVIAIDRHALMKNSAAAPEEEQRLSDALVALDRIEATSEEKRFPLIVRASVLERLAVFSKAKGDFRKAEGLVRQALDISTRLIELSPDDPNAYRNATVFSLNLAEILLSLGDKDGFLAMGENAVRFQKEGLARSQDDDLQRFWLAERLGHYAHMCLRVGHAEDAMRLIAEARVLTARKPFPESLQPRLDQLHQSFDQMEHDISVGKKTQPPQT